MKKIKLLSLTLLLGGCGMNLNINPSTSQTSNQVTSQISHQPGSMITSSSNQTPKEVTGDFVYTTSAALGLPPLNFDWNDSYINDTINDFEFDGYRYIRSYGSDCLPEIYLPDDPISLTTIGIHKKISNRTMCPHSKYENVDYSKYINVKNLIIDYEYSSKLHTKLTLMPRLENIYLTRQARPPMATLNSKVKNLILAYGAYYPSFAWDTNFILPTGVKIIAPESYKYVAHFYARSYQSNANYQGTEDLKVYVIPDNELPVPASRLMIPDKYHPYYHQEYGGVKYLPYRPSSLNDDIFKYTFGYVHPLISKTVFNPNIIDSQNRIIGVPKHQLDTLYLMEGSSKNILQIKAKNLVAELPETFVYSDYTNYQNVYFYQTTKVNQLKITPESLSNTQTVNINFYVADFNSTVNTSTNPNIASHVLTYAGDKLPEIELKYQNYTVSTRTLTKSFDSLYQELIGKVGSDNPGDSQSSSQTSSSSSSQVSSTSGNSDSSLSSSASSSKGSFDQQLIGTILLGALIVLISIAISKGLSWLRKEK